MSLFWIFSDCPILSETPMTALLRRCTALVSPAFALTALLLAGCAATEKGPTQAPPTEGERQRERIGTVSGNREGFILFGGERPNRTDGNDNTGIGVNAFLWKAALDTVRFMPLASADPFGGVIITDWYSPPESPRERLKLTVLIQDRQLRSDAVSVSVFRQVQTAAAGGWQDAAAAPETARRLEDTILTRARQLRVASAPAAE
jgi:Domain of unknown function (DUF3576)